MIHPADSTLDEEALALLRAATGEDFRDFPAQEGLADFWRRAAVKARELHAGTAPRFVVRTAPRRSKPFWIVHDLKRDAVYPFGFGKSAEALAHRAASELEEGKPTLYFADPNAKNYL